MTFVEINVPAVDGITTRQRWSHYFAIALGVLALGFLLNFRSNALNATSVYENSSEGVVAYYPQDWLIDEDGGDQYIFRVRDMQAIGFKTTFQLSVRTVGRDVTPRAVFDTLAMQRAQTRTAYRLLSVEEYGGLGDVEASVANYLYVATDPNPFQESIPIVVRGIDVLTVNRDQAIIITMLSDADHFEENLELFERFLNRLEF
jgi:hypothetical protein